MKTRLNGAQSATNQKISFATALLAAAIPFLMSSPAESQSGVDPKTRDLLITKLTQVYLNLAPADSSKVAITLRLADLHAERARLDAMRDLESGCTVCEAGKTDRKKALGYYQEVITKVPESSVGKVLAQVGHLYEMTGNEKDAITIYEKILRDPKSAEAASEANLSLAEVYFKRRDYAKARGYYSAVLANLNGGSRGLAAYRVAWCDFNDGKTEGAIEGLKKILTTPALASKSGGAAGVAQVDRQFQEEVSRDLATFMARKTVSLDDAKSLYALSPEAAKLPNVQYLASELERLGQSTGAISLWRFAQEKQAKPQDRLEGHVRLAQLEMEQKLLAEAAKDFDSALALWSSMGTCNEQNCAEVKARLRKFVTDWNRVEKKSPSEPLLGAYQSYIRTFPTEADMQLWAGKVAADLKQFPLSVSLNVKAAELASKETKSPAPGAPSSKEVVEASLLQAIEAAELSKDSQLLARAYDSYLNLSNEKKRALEVRYQKAHLIYDAGDYASASNALREVALSKEAGSADIKTQAAQLSLDSLVLLKDDTRLEEWAQDYAKAFPKDADDFRNISRKSVLTQSAAEASKGDSASLNQAWVTLNRFDLSTASAADKAAYYKNRLVLAEKLGKFGDAREAVENLLKSPALSSADQQFALSRKAWLAEMVLDFDTALMTTQKLTTDGLPRDQKALKLAMYAELASKDPKPFYAEFLKSSKDEDKTVAITAQLVRDSKEPAREIEKNRATLLKRPDELGALYLEAYARTGAIDVAKKAVATPAVAATASGKALARTLILEDFSKLQKKIESHQLDSSNQKKMGATLKARVALLDESEKLANKAIESGDWTAELVTLDLLAKQSERFYQEVLALPVPTGLSPEEETEYLTLLSQQAAPHQLRANDVAKKVNEFWDNKAAMAQLESASDVEVGARRTMVMKEIQALSNVAPESKKAQLVSMLAKKEAAKEVPSLASIEGARQAVRESPLNRSKLETLLSLERKTGRNATMVSYLEGRLETLEKGISTGAQK